MNVKKLYQKANDKYVRGFVLYWSGASSDVKLYSDKERTKLLSTSELNAIKDKFIYIVDGNENIYNPLAVFPSSGEICISADNGTGTLTIIKLTSTPDELIAEKGKVVEVKVEAKK